MLGRAVNLLWGALCVLLMAAGVYAHLGKVDAERRAERLRATLAEEREGWAKERLALVAKAREVETEWRARHDDAAAAAQSKIDRAARERDLARAAGDSLRTRAEHYAGLCAGGASGRPAAAGAGEEAAAAGRMLADVLGRMEAHGARVAAFADALDAAHTGCELAHSAMKGK